MRRNRREDRLSTAEHTSARLYAKVDIHLLQVGVLRHPKHDGGLLSGQVGDERDVQRVLAPRRIGPGHTRNQEGTRQQWCLRPSCACQTGRTQRWSSPREGREHKRNGNRLFESNTRQVMLHTIEAILERCLLQHREQGRRQLVHDSLPLLISLQESTHGRIERRKSHVPVLVHIERQRQFARMGLHIGHSVGSVLHHFVDDALQQRTEGDAGVVKCVKSVNHIGMRIVSKLVHQLHDHYASLHAHK